MQQDHFLDSEDDELYQDLLDFNFEGTAVRGGNLPVISHLRSHEIVSSKASRIGNPFATHHENTTFI